MSYSKLIKNEDYQSEKPFDPSWSPEVEELLIELYNKSMRLSCAHSKNYYEYAKQSQYFDLPVIIISTLSATFTVVAPKFISQLYVTAIGSCTLMFITILTSIKLYLALEAKLKNEDDMGTAFGTLSLNLSKMLKLAKWQRNGNGLECLNKLHAEYTKLIESSALPKNDKEHEFLFYFPAKLECHAQEQEIEHRIEMTSIDRGLITNDMIDKMIDNETL